jgi:metal-dependent amidase/aminoacylase/carboxypeptidase family protein
MAKYFLANASTQLGADNITQMGHRSGSTDMGDLSHVMPTLHPYLGGASGTGHGADFTITDPKLAYIENAKQLALMAVDMLWDDAQAAKEIIGAFKPRLSREAYLAFQRGIAKTELFDGAK